MFTGSFQVCDSEDFIDAAVKCEYDEYQKPIDWCKANDNPKVSRKISEAIVEQFKSMGDWTRLRGMSIQGSDGKVDVMMLLKNKMTFFDVVEKYGKGDLVCLLGAEKKENREFEFHNREIIEAASQFKHCEVYTHRKKYQYYIFDRNELIDLLRSDRTLLAI